MTEKDLRSVFLRIILILGVITLGSFSIYYLVTGAWVMGIFEGVFALSFLWALIWIKMGGYTGPAIIGWLGVYSVCLGLLINGGIQGTGIVWWGIAPVIGYVLFGEVGGSVALGVILVTFLAGWVASAIGFYSFYFDSVYLRQTMIMILIEGIILYFFEQTATRTRLVVEKQAKNLKEEIASRTKIEEELNTKLKELGDQQVKQGQIRTAMINLLEDEKELEQELKQEKAGVQKEVAERTSELTAVINSIARGLVVVNRRHEIVLKNTKINKIIEVDEITSFAAVKQFLGDQVDVVAMVDSAFEKKQDVKAEPMLYGSRYLLVHVVPIVDLKTVDEVAIFVSDVTETTNLQRSRDEFFSIASHELRTPLTAIRGNSEMIMDNYGDKIKIPDVQEMLSDIHEGSVRLIEIVNDFLNVSRLEMGKIEFKLEPTLLSKVVTSVVKEFEVTGSRQKIGLRVVVPKEEEPMVVADIDRLKQVVINLIGNGIKFTHDGEIVLKVVPDKQAVRVEVKDSGEGIAKEMQSLLFHKFQQAGSSLYTRDTSKGTGLGLYISKLMMEGMGGKIWLSESVVGKGSTFALELPIAKQAIT